jgi:hypothetical protein
MVSEFSLQTPSLYPVRVRVIVPDEKSSELGIYCAFKLDASSNVPVPDVLHISEVVWLVDAVDKEIAEVPSHISKSRPALTIGAGENMTSIESEAS